MRMLLGVSIAAVVLLVLLGVVVFSVTKWRTQEVIRDHGSYGLLGPSSIEEMTARSKVVARVRFVSVRPVGQRSPVGYPFGDPRTERYYAALEYTFTALEYIKGSGGSQITAFAIGSDVESVKDDSAIYSTSRKKAVRLAEALLEVRDRRWEGREAILFLRYVAAHDYYWLGHLDLDNSAYRNFTVRSTEFKAWLPDANIPAATIRVATAQGSATDKTKAEQRFFLEDPSRTLRLIRSSEGARSIIAMPATASLSEIKEAAADVVGWVDASGATEDAAECVANFYEQERISKANGTDQLRQWEMTARSGQPAGSDAFRYPGMDKDFELSPSLANLTEEDVGKDISYAGRDARLFGNRFWGYITYARPLPAGQYRFFYNQRNRLSLVCDAKPAAARNLREFIVTVVAPAETLAESFFDPYADSAAITGTTTVGTISWQPPSAGSGQAGRVTADLTVDVTGHTLDFIALDGSVSLSLDVANATEADGALTWTVPIQPWSAGDKLMLRIRRVTPQ